MTTPEKRLAALMHQMKLRGPRKEWDRWVDMARALYATLPEDRVEERDACVYVIDAWTRVQPEEDGE